MDVRMMGECLPPGMEDGEAADPCAEPARVCGERCHRFGRGREQDRVDEGLVLERNGRDRRWQGEHHVEIGDRQKFGPARGKPLRPRSSLALRAMAVGGGGAWGGLTYPAKGGERLKDQVYVL